MCSNCWKDHGSPRINTPVVRAAAEAARAVYEFSCVGGNLHIVLDDFNIEDGHLEFCREQIEKAPEECRASGEHENGLCWCSPEQLAAERYCYELFKALSEDERASALAILDGYVGE